MRAKPEHEVAYQELCELINRHADKISAVEILAIASNMVGKLVALQDQNTIKPETAMIVVSRNIQLGNDQVIAELRNTPARGQG